MSGPQHRLLGQASKLLTKYPFVRKPLIISAPMKTFSGAELAVGVSAGGGLGFIGPTAKPEQLDAILSKAQGLIKSRSISNDTGMLPVGVGFQTWDADLEIAINAIGKHKPCAVWLFAPRDGEFVEWIGRIRVSSPKTQIWVQVGTLDEALAVTQVAQASRPDVLVVQGMDAGGHGRAHDGLGLTTLLPEISDALKGLNDIPIVAAGGIADGRGAVSALGLGAVGVAMGTRFLASEEANISKGYQDEILRATNGAKSTVKTTLYNDLRGTVGFPSAFSPRTIINRSWTEHKDGVDFATLKQRHDESLAKGDQGWGPEGRLATYAGTCVGLIKSIKPAAEIVKDTRLQMIDIMNSMASIHT